MPRRWSARLPTCSDWSRASGFRSRRTRNCPTDMQAALVGAIVTAAVSTLGDYLWANVLPHHIPIYGFAHGLILFLTVGACLGWPARRPIAGAIGGAVVGLTSTGCFYLLQPFIGYNGLFVMFVVLWIELGLLTGRVLQQRD